MHEYHLEVRRTARFAALGDLADPREVWFVVHGYGQLAGRFLKRFAGLEGDGRLIVAPEALNRYYFETSPGVHAADAGIGATWMTREDRETDIADYVAYLDSLYEFIMGGMQRVPARVVVLGFSQGAATVSRWLANGKAPVHDVVLWGSPLPPEIEPAAGLFGDASLTMVFGRQDSFTSASWIERESARMNAGGLSHEVLLFDGGHEIAEEPLRTIAGSSPSGKSVGSAG